jgi:hypothetical protein
MLNKICLAIAMTCGLIIANIAFSQQQPSDENQTLIDMIDSYDNMEQISIASDEDRITELETQVKTLLAQIVTLEANLEACVNTQQAQ